MLGLIAEGEHERRQFIFDLHICMQRLVEIADKLCSIWSVHPQALGNLVEDDQFAVFLLNLLTRLGLFLLSSRFSGGLTKARTHDGLLVYSCRSRGAQPVHKAQQIVEVVWVPLVLIVLERPPLAKSVFNDL